MDTVQAGIPMEYLGIIFSRPNSIPYGGLLNEFELWIMKFQVTYRRITFFFKISYFRRYSILSSKYRRASKISQ